MNKKLMYVVVAVVVLAVIAGVLFYMNQGSGPASNLPGAQAPMSMKDLLAQGGSQKCTFSNAVAGAESSGTIYVASGRMRGDFSAKVSGGQVMESHMIVDGQTAYIWTNQMPQGVKMTVDMMGAQTGQSSASVGIDEKMNYNCSGWSADQSKLAVPSDITFTDLTAIQAGVGLPQ